jgi:hypothetical protein
MDLYCSIHATLLAPAVSQAPHTPSREASFDDPDNNMSLLLTRGVSRGITVELRRNYNSRRHERSRRALVEKDS